MVLSSEFNEEANPLYALHEKEDRKMTLGDVKDIMKLIK